MIPTTRWHIALAATLIGLSLLQLDWFEVVKVVTMASVVAVIAVVIPGWPAKDRTRLVIGLLAFLSFAGTAIISDTVVTVMQKASTPTPLDWFVLGKAVTLGSAWTVMVVVIPCLSVAVVIPRWRAKERTKPPREADACILREPRSTLVICLLNFFLFAGAGIVFNTVGKNASTSLWTTAFFLAFAGLGLALVVYYHLGRHRVSSEGLDYGTFFGFGRRGFIRWDDVQTITWSPRRGSFAVRSRSGEKVGISAGLMGLPVFSQHVLNYVSSECMDEPTFSIVCEAAEGNAPRVW